MKMDELEDVHELDGVHRTMGFVNIISGIATRRFFDGDRNEDHARTGIKIWIHEAADAIMDVLQLIHQDNEVWQHAFAELLGLLKFLDQQRYLYDDAAYLIRVFMFGFFNSMCSAMDRAGNDGFPEPEENDPYIPERWCHCTYYAAVA